jgi:hypothetical protein
MSSHYAKIERELFLQVPGISFASFSVITVNNTSNGEGIVFIEMEEGLHESVARV